MNKPGSGFLWSQGADKSADTGQDTGPDAEMMAFLAGDDVKLDRQMFSYDIRATAAHVNGLQRIGILNEQECQQIQTCLQQLLDAWQAGEFELDERYEDGHSAIESYATEQLGDLGRKIHTGRSRNDQVLVATRLYLLDQLKTLQQRCVQVAEAALQRAQQDEFTPMPGYTHLQLAVPSSIGLWMGAFTEAFIDNAELVTKVHAQLDQSPLGTAAGYGVNLPLDRQGVADELGFARLQLNPMYAQNSRGKFELLALQALGQATLDVRRLAWDLSLFTSSEFAFIQLPGKWRTGSSIMPNKANPDLIELLRALHSGVLAAQVELDTVTALPSGYQRDLQNTKPAMLRPWNSALAGLHLLARLLQDIEFERDKMASAIRPEMFATDRAIELASSGMAFRDAYQTTKATENNAEQARNASQSLQQRVSAGACGDLRLSELQKRLDSQL